MIKPLGPLTHSATILLKIVIGLDATAVLVGFFALLEQLVSAGGPYSLLVSDIPVGLVGLGQVGFQVTFAVVFLMWVYRLSRQLHARSSAYMEYSAAWAVGWYFVPIASLFKPYQAMRELWSVCHRSASRVAEPVLGWWWGLWIATSILGNIAARLTSAVESGVAPSVSTIVMIFADGAGLAAGIALLMVMTRMSDAYLSNYGDMAAPAQAAPGATDLRMPPPGWSPDPMKRHQSRYWDGSQWTHWVADDGVQATDPL